MSHIAELMCNFFPNVLRIVKFFKEKYKSIDVGGGE